MPVTKSNILHDILYFVKNDLETNISDPLTSRATNSDFVLTSYPSRPVQYPIITIKCTNYEAKRTGLQTTTQDITISLEIRIWARNEKEKDTISQDILNRLANIQFTSSTGSIANNLHDVFIGSAVEVDEPGSPGAKTIKSRIIQIQYRFYNNT